MRFTVIEFRLVQDYPKKHERIGRNRRYVMLAVLTVEIFTARKLKKMSANLVGEMSVGIASGLVVVGLVFPLAKPHALSDLKETILR